jgi:RimJ/RimL family protein N-acetyltransferase
MQRLIDEATSAELPIRLRVLKVNTRAAAFYDRLGFARVGEIDTHVLMERAHSPARAR